MGRPFPYQGKLCCDLLVLPPIPPEKHTLSVHACHLLLYNNILLYITIFSCLLYIISYIMHLVQIINTDKFDVTVISPRNFYVFTPMLPSCAVGTVEFRSLVDPIRVANPFVTYIEAKATDVDPQRKTLSCVCTAGGGVESTSPREFEMAYDYLFVSIGEVPATFGVPGVAEHCYFMKVRCWLRR